MPLFPKNTIELPVVEFLLKLMNTFRPSEQRLKDLSKQDRPGLTINLPVIEASLLERGRTAFGDGEYSEALHCFSALITEQPTNAWGWHGRGDALQLMGEPSSALEAYDQAIKFQPNCALHYGGRANALKALQRYSDSKLAKQQALELDESLTWLFTD
jgi:tetratricopeptide (TPR) repeat protein